MRRKPVKTHVSFKRDSSTLDNESQPLGEDIAASLVASLASQGLGDCVLDSIDYAFTLFAPADSRCCYVMVGFVGDEPQQWLITCGLSRGIFDRLRRKNYDAEINSVVKSIHKFLADDSAVTDIRWFTADGWNSGSGTWSRSP